MPPPLLAASPSLAPWATPEAAARDATQRRAACKADA